MTLEELENTLPNGLHDAEVRSLTVDYSQRLLVLEMEVWVGSMDDPPDRREAYKTGRLEISGLVFLVMEPPDPRYPYRIRSKLTIDATEVRKGLDPELLATLPPDFFFRTLWVNEWNACMHLAAKDAEMTWRNGGAITYRARQELKAKSLRAKS
jgi:hypothetical protein